MTGSHWKDLFRAWSVLPKPVAVAPETIAAIKAQVREVRGPILLLGLTRQLMDTSDDLVAIDRSVEMVLNRAGAVRTVAGDWTGSAIAGGTKGAAPSGTSNAGSAVGNTVGVHITADARL